MAERRQRHLLLRAADLAAAHGVARDGTARFDVDLRCNKVVPRRRNHAGAFQHFPADAAMRAAAFSGFGAGGRLGLLHERIERVRRGRKGRREGGIGGDGGVREIEELRTFRVAVPADKGIYGIMRNFYFLELCGYLPTFAVVLKLLRINIK